MKDPASEESVKDEQTEPRDDIRVGPVVLAGVIGAVLLFAMIVGLSALFLRQQQKAAYDERASRSPDELHSLESGQIERLSEYTWINQKKGIVRIPIERAMKLVVEDAGEKKR